MNKVWWRECWRARRLDAWAVLFIALFFVLFFHPIFFGGKFFVINDAFVYSYPLRVAVWAEVRDGRMPLWTPLLMSGYPLLSMAQIGLGYPLTWGYLFLPGRWAEQIYTLAPYLLAPAFIYAYAREIKRTRLAALLAGLTFGYGGLMVSAVANNGLLANAVMWLPLMLIAIERARKGRFIPCLLAATFAYMMSVLTGIGQGFVYAGALAFAYATFLTLAARPLSEAEDASAPPGWRQWERWRPLVVAAVAMILSAGVAAFQILETMRAQRRSIRSILSYEIFTEGAYTFKLAIKSFLFPLHYINHATAWVSPLALVLAALAVVAAVRSDGRRRDARVLFWLAVAMVAWVLMLGASTPVYRLVYHIPVINRFRAPARHAFEWTFAVAILSSYGWDYASTLLRRAQGRLSGRQTAVVITGLLLLVAGATVGLLWQLDFARTPPRWDESNHYPNFPEARYLLWKSALAVITFLLVWLGWRHFAPRWRALLLAGAVALACFVEPSIMAARWWWPALKSPARFTVVSPATRFLQAHAPEEYRSYTRTVLWTEEYLEQPRLDSSNLTMLHGLRNTGGYEPLILERYSRALGNVTMDTANPRPGLKPDLTLFEPRSRVLDILNTAYVVSYADQLTEPTLPIERDGIRFGAPNISQEVKPGETTRLEGAAHVCDTLALVTSMADSAQEADGAVVAKLRLFTNDGRVFERELRAGVDTAEWAHDRADVLRVIRHRLAPVFDSFPGDEQGSFIFHRYWTRIPLDERATIDHIEITNVSAHALFGLWKMTLYDSATKFSMPLPHYDLNRWEPAYEQDGVEIIRNKRALPRVWLVAEAVAVDGEEALRRIRGESDASFDPERTALLEVSPQELPQLPGGALASGSNARLTASEPNHLVIETASLTPTVLVTSELNYPGWTATVDGHDAPLRSTDFLLRGVALNAGAHRVEMRYTAPAARNGALLSALTLLLLGALALIGRRARRKR
jgi:Bacterial membrane protein YfhO